jgi:hypothetical protein
VRGSEAATMPSDNPFVLLTFIAAPAMLTNASSVLALSTGNRYGRAFDRAKEVGEALGETGSDDTLLSFRLDLLERLAGRTTLLLRAQVAFFWAIGLFVFSALVSILGATIGVEEARLFRMLVVAGFVAGVMATLALVYGCALIVRETRIAMSNLRDEKVLLFTRYAQGRHPEGRR